MKRSSLHGHLGRVLPGVTGGPQSKTWGPDPVLREMNSGKEQTQERDRRGSLAELSGS